MGTRGIKANDRQDELVAHLYKLGAVTVDIRRYLDISHGTVVNALRRKNVPTRGRGRPRADEPPHPSPTALMGLSYSPPWMSGPEAEAFVRRVATMRFRAEEVRENTRKRRQQAATRKQEKVEEAPLIDPISKHAQITGLDDSPPPPSSPSDVIAARLAGENVPGTNAASELSPAPV